MQYREALKMLSKEDLTKFLDNPSNMQCLILQNKVEMERRTSQSFFPQHPRRDEINNNFDSLIKLVDEEGQSLMKVALEKEQFLVEGNRYYRIDKFSKAQKADPTN